MQNRAGKKLRGKAEINSLLAELDGVADSMFSSARLLEGLLAEHYDEPDSLDKSCVAATSSMMYAHSDSIRRTSNAIRDIYEAHSRELTE